MKRLGNRFACIVIWQLPLRIINRISVIFSGFVAISARIVVEVNMQRQVNTVAIHPPIDAVEFERLLRPCGCVIYGFSGDDHFVPQKKLRIVFHIVLK